MRIFSEIKSDKSLQDSNLQMQTNKYLQLKLYFIYTV